MADIKARLKAQVYAKMIGLNQETLNQIDVKARHVKEGIKFYSSQEKIEVGTMPTMKGYEITPGNKKIIVPGDAYLEGDIMVLPISTEQAILTEEGEYEPSKGKLFDHVTVALKSNWKHTINNNYQFNAKACFVASNGIDMYFSNYEGGNGMWHVNRQTGEVKQIYTSGNKWHVFFEDSNGNVYVGSSTNSGILYLNGETATHLYNHGYTFEYFFEDSAGNVYASGNSKGGLLHINGTTTNQIFSGDYTYKYFFEDSKGNVYANINEGGLLYLNGANANQISNVVTSCLDCFFEDSKGNVYVSGTEAHGVYHLNGKQATYLLSNVRGACKFFEDSKGNVYVGSIINTVSGIYRLYGIATTQIYSRGCGWKYFYEDSKGNVYASSDYNVYETGIVRLNGLEEATQIYSSGYGWKYFFEGNDGNAYVTRVKEPKEFEPILKLEGTNVTTYFYIE